MKPTTVQGYVGQPVLINRENDPEFQLPKDGWYHIVPKGEFIHKPTGLMQVIDDQACKNIINRFNAEKTKPHFPGILVDYDHFSQDTDKPSEAAGWIAELDNREDGVWAQIRWSDKGKEAVQGGRYRLVSPVWKRLDCETLDNGRVRPKRLDSVALTNDPNLKGLVPLSNRSGWESDADVDYKLELISLLGLGSDATDEEIKQALDERQHAPKGEPEKAKPKKVAGKRGLRNRSSDMDGEVQTGLSEAEVQEILSNREAEFQQEAETLRNRIEELEAENETLKNAQVDSDLREFNSVITDAEATKEMLLSNRESTIKMLTGLKKQKETAKKAPNAPLHNREEAEQPTLDNSAGEEVAAKIMNRCKEIQSTVRINGKPVNFAQAWQMARKEVAK